MGEVEEGDLEMEAEEFPLRCSRTLICVGFKLGDRLMTGEFKGNLLWLGYASLDLNGIEAGVRKGSKN